MPLLDNAYANALLFSVGLLLGSTGESAGSRKHNAKHDSTASPAQREAGGSDSELRWGKESDSLSALRSAQDRRFFGQLDDLTAELELVSERLDALGSRDGHRLPLDFDVGDRVVPRDAAFWERLRMPEIRFEPNARVEKYVRFFTESAEGRKMLVAWLERSGRYREIIFEKLRKNDLPREIIAVAFIESGLRPKAVSSTGATGLWQFMPRTARAYGLKVDRRHDERRSIWRSTDAAIRHLSDLYEYFRSWELAFAAYNYGYERLAALSERMATRDFWSLSAMEGALPKETATYVPKVLAVAVILNNLDRFDLGDVRLDAALEGTPLQVAGGTRMSLIARAAGTSLETMRTLNPEFRDDVTPRGDRPVVVRIPANGLARAQVMLPRLLEDAEDNREDTRVSAGFNWGRDDPEGETLDRLSKTIHGGRMPPSSRAGDLGQRTQQANGYFAEESVYDPVEEEPTRARSTASSVVSASGKHLASEGDGEPRTGELFQQIRRSSSMETDPAPSASLLRLPGKRRAKPRQDRQIIFYLSNVDETTEMIANRFNVDPGELRRVNRMGTRDALTEGTLVRVPIMRVETPRLSRR